MRWIGPSMVAQTCNSNTLESEAGVGSQSGLYRETLFLKENMGEGFIILQEFLCLETHQTILLDFDGDHFISNANRIGEEVLSRFFLTSLLPLPPVYKTGPLLTCQSYLTSDKVVQRKAEKIKLQDKLWGWKTPYYSYCIPVGNKKT